MYKHVYDSLKHWYERGGTIWFYSDPHFNDEEMKYLRKDYIGDDAQVLAINKKVTDRDTIVFLGDIGDINFIPKIRGYKVLIMGNHDTGAFNYRRRVIDTKDNHLFDEVYEGPLTIAEKIILSHEPVDIMGMINIHGHTHGLPLHPTDKSWNVCAENINYTPICFKEIVNSGMIGDTLSIHRLAINKQKEQKIEKF